MQDYRSADAEAHYCGERDHFHGESRHLQEIDGQGCQRAKQAENVEPQRRSHLKILPEPELEQECGQPNRGNYHQRDRT